MFEIIEDMSRGKSASRAYTEDRVIKAAGHFGILDGSRGPGYGGDDVITGILDEAVDFISAMPADITLPALVTALTELTAAQKQRAGFSDFRLTGGYVFCLYSAQHNQIWRVGDCKFRQAGKTFENFWSIEETCAQARALMLTSLGLNGVSDADIMALPNYDDIIADLLLHEANFLNRADIEGSFGAVIGLPVPETSIECYPARPGDLIITSDGYPVVCDTLEQSEAALADLLVRDPLCVRDNLQCKGLGLDRVSFDDRAFVRARLTD